MHIDNVGDIHDHMNETDAAHHNSDMFHESTGVLAAKTGFSHGNFVIKAPNMAGGHDTFVNGQHTTHTEHNALGGQNVYHGHELAELSVPNVHGGIDIYDGHMQPQGSFVPDVHGGEDYLSLRGNGDAIMHYNDPLAHSSEFRMEPFDVARLK